MAERVYSFDSESKHIQPPTSNSNLSPFPHTQSPKQTEIHHTLHQTTNPKSKHNPTEFETRKTYMPESNQGKKITSASLFP